MFAAGHKDPGALLTIGELSHELGVAQHILRYWETKFPQLRPMQRAGNRRYYRAADVELARRINRLLNEEGYTVRGVQKVLRDRQGADLAPDIRQAAAPAASLAAVPDFEPRPLGEQRQAQPSVDLPRLVALRDRLLDALGS